MLKKSIFCEIFHIFTKTLNTKIANIRENEHRSTNLFQ